MSNSTLQALDFLGSLDETEKKNITKKAYEVTVPAGWAPMWEGTPGDKVYLILEGTASVRRGGEEIAQVGPGDLVGEGSFVNRRLRSATVVALTPLRVLTFPARTWRSVTDEHPSLAEAARAVAASRN